MAIGRRIHALRRGTGMTQRQVARLTGLAPSYLSRLENGRITPSIATLTRLAAAFELGVDAFFEAGSDLEAGDRCPVSLCGKCILDLSFRSAGRQADDKEETYTSEHLEILKLCNAILHSGDARIRGSFMTMVRALAASLGAVGKSGLSSPEDRLMGTT